MQELRFKVEKVFRAVHFSAQAAPIGDARLNVSVEFLNTWDGSVAWTVFKIAFDKQKYSRKNLPKY